MNYYATPSPIPQYFDTDGSPLDNGSLYFGAAGQNPETSPITVYWDAAGTQPAAQPIKTRNGFPMRAGAPAQVFVNGSYSQTVKTGRGVLVFYVANAQDPTVFLASPPPIGSGTPNAGTFTSLNGGPLAGLRNSIINGDFQVWQRGTSFPAAAGITYTADRWAFYRSALSLGATASQNSPSGIAGSSSYAIRVQRDAGNSSTDPLNLAQCLESATARRLAGKTVTLSFKQRTGSHISTSNIGVSVICGTGFDQGINNARAGSWTGQAALISSGFSTGQSSFKDTALQFSVPANALELMVVFAYTPTGTAGANDYFDIADVQFETGTAATPLEQRPIGLELALCRRYRRRYATAQNTSDLAYEMRATPTQTGAGPYDYDAEL